MTESTKVQAAFLSNKGVTCVVTGILKSSSLPDGFLVVGGSGSPDEVPRISFTLPTEGGAAYADNREFPARDRARFDSALTIAFADGSELIFTAFREQ